MFKTYYCDEKINHWYCCQYIYTHAHMHTHTYTCDHWYCCQYTHTHTHARICCMCNNRGIVLIFPKLSDLYIPWVRKVSPAHRADFISWRILWRENQTLKCTRIKGVKKKQRKQRMLRYTLIKVSWFKILITSLVCVIDFFHAFKERGSCCIETNVWKCVIFSKV
jgi:hypothetical protein